jgi:hypothetical protein
VVRGAGLLRLLAAGAPWRLQLAMVAAAALLLLLTRAAPMTTAMGRRMSVRSSSCSFNRHSYTGKSLGGRPVVPADNQTQCCEICRSLTACEAANLDPKAGRCYPATNISGWGIDARYIGCVPSHLPTSQTFTFAAADTVALTFDAATLALRNVTVVAGGVRQGLLHTDDPWQSVAGFPLWRLNVSDCASPVEYPMTAITAGA